MVYQLFRRYQQPIMITVSLVTIISFAGLYSKTDVLEKGSSHIAEIYGRNITLPQVQRANRKADLCLQLAQMEMQSGMFGPRQEHAMADLYQSLAISRQDSKENFIWNSLVLKHEAERLGVEPTEDEIFDALKAMPVFQTNGAYDSQKYQNIAPQLLDPRGLTTEDFSDLVGMALRLKRIKALLGATVAPSQAEIRDAFTRLNQKTEASVVRFKLEEMPAATQVPDEDVKKFFEERKGSLKTDELRKVKYVAFILPTTDKPLEGPDRAKKLTELQKQAEDFAVAMTEKDAKFEEVAAKLKAKVEESPDFSVVNPPEALGSSGDVAAAAFKLTPHQPNSDILETPRGYYVLQFAGATPPRPLTFDEAKANLAETLKRERAMEALNIKATEDRNKIETEMKGGKSFADAAQALGVKVEAIPAFSPKEPGSARDILSVAMELKDGELSKVVPSAGGSTIVYVAKRLPIDEKQLETEKGQFSEGLVDFQRAALFQEWLKLRRAAAQLKTAFRAS